MTPLLSLNSERSPEAGEIYTPNKLLFSEDDIEYDKEIKRGKKHSQSLIQKRSVSKPEENNFIDLMIVN